MKCKNCKKHVNMIKHIGKGILKYVCECGYIFFKLPKIKYKYCVVRKKRILHIPWIDFSNLLSSN
jgi:hypothetical protein